MKQVWFKLAAAIITIVLSTVYTASWFTPSVGSYRDDGIYAVTAKALAENRGYRIISQPNEIPQTKYPFLFPAALSLVWRLRPDFPGNVTALKTLPLLCALVWFFMSYKLMLRIGGKKEHAVWSVLLAAASPLVIFLSTNLMSEPMFGALFMGALLAADAAEKSESNKMAWFAGILAALAFLTRTLGLSLLIGIPVALAIRHRYSALWRFGMAAVPIAGVWPIWVLLQTYLPDDAEVYYSSANYSSWNIVTNYAFGEKARILLENVLLSLVSPAALLDFPTSLWTALVMLILLITFFIKGSVKLDTIHISIAAYTLLFLCWAWPPARFIAVLLPIIIFMIWKTLAQFAQLGPMRYIGTSVAVLLFCFVVAGDLRRIPRTVSDGQFASGNPANNWTELTDVFCWVRSNTSEKAVLLANLNPLFYLYTDRKAMLDVVPDALKLFYSSGSPADDSIGSLAEIIRSTPTDFLIVTPDEDFAEAPVLRRNVERFKFQHPGALELVERPSADSRYLIYRIRRDRL